MLLILQIMMGIALGGFLVILELAFLASWASKKGNVVAEDPKGLHAVSGQKKRPSDPL